VVGAFPVGPTSSGMSEVVLLEAGVDDTSGQQQQPVDAVDDVSYPSNQEHSFHHISISLPGNLFCHLLIRVQNKCW